MKKVLLVVALLLLATPVFAADVTITATVGQATKNPGDGNELIPITVGYTSSAPGAISAFALRMTSDSNAALDHIRDFNIGESKGAVPGGKSGYGIFPGKFRNAVVVNNGTEANYTSIDYNPVAPAGDFNSGGYQGSQNLVMELGTMYTNGGPGFPADNNKPPASGTLFVIDVNSHRGYPDNASTTGCNVCIVVEQSRGGVVKADANAATVTLPGTAGCFFVPFPPSTCTEPNLVNRTMADANTQLINAGFSAAPIITYEPNGLKAALTVDRQTPLAGAVVACNTVTHYVVDTNCLYVGRVFDLPTGLVDITVTQAMVDKWNYLGKPACWCCLSQKRGNVNYTGSGATVVNAADLAAVKNLNTWGKAYTQVGYNACADFDMSGTVNASDLAKVKNLTNWGKVVGSAPPCQ